MKNIFKVVLVCFIIKALVACNSDVKTGDGSQQVSADGTSAVETRNVNEFNKIEIDGVFEVFLTQGTNTEVKIECDKNILSHIITNVNNNTLRLKMEENTNFGNIDPIKIFIQFKDLHSLTTAGVGTVSSKAELILDTFNLNCKGVGAINLKISANNLIVNSETVGAISLAGKVIDANIKHNGVGVLQAFDLITQNLKLKSDGIGAAEVYASEAIDIDANGIGSVTYKGNPKVKNIKSEGIGKVSTAD